MVTNISHDTYKKPPKQTNKQKNAVSWSLRPISLTGFWKVGNELPLTTLKIVLLKLTSADWGAMSSQGSRKK